MENQSELVTAIKAISEDYWRSQNSPILLSALPLMLEKSNPNYRAVLGDRTLKAFVRETENTESYKLVEHPIQRARVGVVPAEANYEFPQGVPSPPTVITAKNSQEVTLAFFRALATLPEDDLDKVVIPVSVLVKLLK